MKKILFILAIITTFTVSAQVEFTGVGPSVVSLNQRFYLKYTVNKKGSNFKLPDLKAFQILSGPNTSYSSSVSIVNGNMTQNTSYTYTMVLLATKVGKFTLQPATIVVDGKTIKSNKVTIEVVKGNSNASANTNSGNNYNQTNQNKQTQTTSAGKNLFVRITTNKKNVYLGEQLTATIKLYTKYDIRGFQDAEYPNWNGFYKQDIQMPDQISLTKENINGEIYYTAVLDKVVLQPQKTGTIIIDPAKFEVVILSRSNRQRSIWDDFFNSGYTQKVVKVQSNKVKINVKPLPAAPEGFDGAVGDFKISAKLDKNTIDVNDAISLKIKISGTGNLKLINEPEINFPPDFELFDDAKVNDKINNSSNGSSGYREFEYLFSPRHSGTYQIPPVKFVYFNPVLKKYKTLTTKEFTITVNKGDGDETNTQRVITGVTKEDIKYLGKDIRFIKTGDLKLHKKGDFIFGSPFFILAYIIFLLLFAIIFVIVRKQIKDNANLELVKNRKASKYAKRRLKKAAKAMKENNKDKFYEEITKAVFGYISDKLNIPNAELSKENIRETLEKHNVNEEIMNELIDIIDTCEFERYAPSSKENWLQEIYKTTETLINKIERKIKKAKF